ncbi:MAG: hypothetical protein M3004_13865 [Bacteroidota bacterium]|nr:hypothetical protein [Bacteroidota bacterium]
MLTLNYITGKEAVKVLDNDSFDEFLRYVSDENPDCLHEKNFDNEKEMQQFVAGLEAGGYDNYYIIDANETKEIMAAIG